MTDREILELLLKNQQKMQGDIDSLKEDVTCLKEDVAQLKEDSEITRYASNLLLKWAEDNFPQYPLTQKRA